MTTLKPELLQNPSKRCEDCKGNDSLFLCLTCMQHICMNCFQNHNQNGHTGGVLENVHKFLGASQEAITNLSIIGKLIELKKSCMNVFERKIAQLFAYTEEVEAALKKAQITNELNCNVLKISAYFTQLIKYPIETHAAHTLDEIFKEIQFESKKLFPAPSETTMVGDITIRDSLKKNYYKNSFGTTKRIYGPFADVIKCSSVNGINLVPYLSDLANINPQPSKIIIAGKKIDGNALLKGCVNKKSKLMLCISLIR